MSNAGRPQAGEHAPYFSRYIDLVPEEDIIGTIEAQGRELTALLSPLGEEKAAFRYAPEKWSVKEVLGHLCDAERIFAYRLLSIARGETQPLPGFDENDYMRGANFDQRSFADLLDDFDASRRATLTLLRGLPDDAWTRSGTANDNKTSVRAIAYTLAGHARHHLGVLRSRYL